MLLGLFQGCTTTFCREKGGTLSRTPWTKLVDFDGTVLIVTIIYQAIMAALYLARRKHLAAYLAETPGWILDTQRKSR